MAFGAFLAGTLVGIAAAIIGILALGLPVWAGLVVWCGAGTGVALLLLAVRPVRPEPSGGRAGM